jgi:hypothetical protein
VTDLQIHSRRIAKRVLSHAFLLVLGFSCCGITSHLPRCAFGSESEAEMEEVESRELCCSESRPDSRRSAMRRSLDVSWPVRFESISSSFIAKWPLVGHRISSDNLAPIRC